MLFTDSCTSDNNQPMFEHLNGKNRIFFWTGGWSFTATDRSESNLPKSIEESTTGDYDITPRNRCDWNSRLKPKVRCTNHRTIPRHRSENEFEGKKK